MSSKGPVVALVLGVLALGGSAAWVALADPKDQEKEASWTVEANLGPSVLVCPPGIADPDLLLGAATVLEDTGEYTVWVDEDATTLQGGGSYVLSEGTSDVVALSAAGESSGDLLSFDLEACQSPQVGFGFAAGSTAVGESAVLVLANPSEKTVEATIRVFDGETVDSLVDVSVPAQSTVYTVPGVWAAGAQNLAITVEASGSGLAAWLQSSGLDGEVPTGLSRVGAQQASRTLVLPGVFAEQTGVLRLVNPTAATAQVELALMREDGMEPLPGFSSATLLPGTILEIDVSSLPAGTSALRVDSDTPIIADATMTQEGQAHPEVKDQHYYSRTLVGTSTPVTAALLPEAGEIAAAAEALGLTDIELSLSVANRTQDAVAFEVQGVTQTLAAGASGTYLIGEESTKAALSAPVGLDAAVVVKASSEAGVLESVAPLGLEGTLAQSRVVELIPSR